MDTLKQVYLLQMRKACTEMELANECARRDSNRGEWQCDWNLFHTAAQNVFDEALACLKTIPNWQD